MMESMRRQGFVYLRGGRRTEKGETGQRLRTNFSPTTEKMAARAPMPFIGGRIELGHAIRSNPRSFGHDRPRPCAADPKAKKSKRPCNARTQASEQEAALAASIAMIGRARDVLYLFFFLLFPFIYFY
jgi:hypothetical protein